MENKKDEQVKQLFKVVQQKKAEIAKAERPNWLTNCSFSYVKDTSAKINFQVLNDVEELVTILAFLLKQEDAFNAANEILGTNITFKWLGFTLADWQADISTRINKIQISKKKKELETLEVRLNGLVSKEMRDQMELDEITKLLNTSL